jgi:hypothetical protein
MASVNLPRKGENIPERALKYQCLKNEPSRPLSGFVFTSAKPATRPLPIVEAQLDVAMDAYNDLPLTPLEVRATRASKTTDTTIRIESATNNVYTVILRCSFLAGVTTQLERYLVFVLGVVV